MTGGDLVTRGDAEPTALDHIRTFQEHGVLDDVSLRPGELRAGLTVGQTLAIAGLLGRFHRSVPWWIGDLIIWAQDRWGQDVVGQIEAATGLAPETLADYERMAETIPPADRVPGLSFRHHRAVKALDSQERRAWLSRAVERGWSSDKLRVELVAATERARSEPPETSAEGAEVSERAQDLEPPALQVETLSAVAAEIVAAERDEHGRVCLGANLLERLRAALDAEAS